MKTLVCLLLSAATLSANSPEHLRYQISNLDAEVQTLTERVNSQAQIADELRQGLNKIKQIDQSQVKTDHEQIKKIKDHANQLADTLSAIESRLAKLEKSSEKNQQNIVSMQSALQALMQALQVEGSSTGENTYKVQSGDSLDKIARKHHTSAKVLRDLNQLKNDRIFPGQVINLPAGS